MIATRDNLFILGDGPDMTVIDGVRIFDSWINGNNAGNVSAIYTTSYLRIERSTVTGNRSTINESAIWARGNSSDAVVGGGVAGSFRMNPPRRATHPEGRTDRQVRCLSRCDRLWPDLKRARVSAHRPKR